MRILERATTVLRRIVDLGLLALIAAVVVALILAKGAPLVGRQSIVIGGQSMEPAIQLGSAIVVEPVDPADLDVGDVVSMQVGPERATFTHRISTVVDRPDGRWLRTKGDANAAPDPTLVPAAAVIGRVEVVVPLIGYLIVLLSMPAGVIFVLGLAATLLAIAWLLESLEPESDPAATSPAHPSDVATSQGEPIAARQVRRRPSGDGLSTAFAGSGSPTTSSDRATIREHFEQRREVRRRRARWLGGSDSRTISG